MCGRVHRYPGSHQPIAVAVAVLLLQPRTRARHQQFLLIELIPFCPPSSAPFSSWRMMQCSSNLPLPAICDEETKCRMNNRHKKCMQFDMHHPCTWVVHDEPTVSPVSCLCFTSRAAFCTIISRLSVWRRSEPSPSTRNYRPTQ